ncbi:helix-turn-helix domain-containing protein [Streptomyces sp. NPDC047002]|uniref:helix-turn-helix domain-containing protein n=1 Tax=Streptomyces sp. NPDC047002 TaxID=3155475 RepID=UPI00345691FB
MTTATPRVVQLLYTPKEAAEALRIGRSTLYELLATGDVKSIKIGRSRRIRHDDLASYVARLHHESVH